MAMGVAEVWLRNSFSGIEFESGLVLTKEYNALWETQKIKISHHT